MRTTFKRTQLLACYVLAGALCSCSRVSVEQDCSNKMNQLYSAAVSVCLEQRLKPDQVINMSVLSAYVRPTDLVCSAGKIPYSSFSVLQGPACPNGHKFEPGAARPLRVPSSNFKVASLYEAHGFTNLIDYVNQPMTGHRTADQKKP